MPLHVDVITPEKKSLSDDVDFLVVPGEDGEIGILPGHIPLLARLGHGVIRLKKSENTNHLAISGGFLKVEDGHHVTIFAETAEMAAEIDLERARLAAEKAKDVLAEAKDLTAEELAKVESALNRALLRLKVGQIQHGSHRRHEYPPDN